MPLLLAGGNPARAQDESGGMRDEAADLFARAFEADKAGEWLELQGKAKAKEALESYQKADWLLEELQQRFPAWKPELVGYRRKAVSDEMTKLAGPHAVHPATYRIPGVVAVSSVPDTRRGAPAATALPPGQPQAKNDAARDMYWQSLTSLAQVSGSLHSIEEKRAAYRSADEILAELQKRYPDWEPQIVASRRNNLVEWQADEEESYARDQRMQLLEAAGKAGPAPAGKLEKMESFSRKAHLEDMRVRAFLCAAAFALAVLLVWQWLRRRAAGKAAPAAASRPAALYDY